jgi:hypothetical protein
LTLEVNATTGATRIVNEQTHGFDLSYYEIDSAAGSLNASRWISLDDTESSPNPTGAGWDMAPASSSKILNEVNLISMTTLSPNNVASLGNAFSVGGAQDVRFFYAGPNEETLRTGIVRYVSGAGNVAGDYNSNAAVDAADYVRWRKGGALQNEGRTTGVVDQQDYNFWRLRFGATAGSGAGGSIGVSAVPEPGTLVPFSIGTLLLRRRRTYSMSGR